MNSATGGPANKVQIVAETEGAREGEGPATVTDASGTFRLVKLEPGRYRLRARRNGFLETYYGARRPDAKGTVLRLEAGQELKDLKIKLQPFGVITGTIRESDGEPLLGASVSALRFTYQKGKRAITVEAQARTDDIGQYRIANLPPGQYYVRATLRLSDSDFAALDRSGSNAGIQVLAPALYPGVTDGRIATPLEIGPGSRVAGIDLTLPQMQVFRVKGQVAMPPGNVSTPSVRMFSMSRVEPEMIFPDLSARPNKDGKFEIHGVPAGPYRLQAITNWMEGNAHRTLIGYTEVTVSREDVTGVWIAPEPGAEIRAQVVVEGEGAPNLEGASLRFVGIDNGSSVNFGIRKGEDVFRMELQRGRYAVAVELPPGRGSLFLKSARTATADVLADGLTVPGPVKIDVEVVLSAEAGSVAGVVADKDGNPMQGATVVIVPARLRTRVDLFKEAATDQNGRFELGSLAPGDYKMFAWDDVEPGMWFDPEFLKRFESKAESVKVTAKGRSGVTLRAMADLQ